MEERARRTADNMPIALVPRPSGVQRVPPVPRAPAVPRSFRPTTPAVRKGGALEPVRLHGAELLDAIARDKDEIGIAVHAVGAAERCLSIAARYFGCRSALLRHADPKRGADLVVAARGAASDFLMARAEPDAHLLVEGRHAIVAHASLGGARRVALEIAEPHDDVAFTGEDVAALLKLGELYASLIVRRGVLTDAADVARYALSSGAKR